MNPSTSPAGQDGAVPPAMSAPRKPYRAPVLTCFGHVAQLTQGGSCSAMNDGNAVCGSDATAMNGIRA